MDEALGHPGRPLPASPYAAGQWRERVWTIRLSFQAARGSLTLGSQHTLDLHAATPLAFRNIEGPGVIGEHLVVPVRINSRTAKVRIQGRAETLVNNDPYLTEQPAWVRFIDVDFVTVVATLIGLFLSASTYLLARNVGGRHH